MSSLSSLCLGYRKGAAPPKPRAILSRLLFALLLCALCASASAQANSPAKELRVAAASDLRTALPNLAADYEKATGTRLVISYASSSALATQIVNGAPFDVFLGADFSFPEKVVAAGLADSASPTLYARGTLVLWARKDSPLQPLSLNSLSDPRVQHIALADDIRAPYGIAAVRTLTAMHLTAKLKDKLVRADNVEQAGQFAQSGNAQLAFISLSQALSPQMTQTGTHVLAPPHSYPPINQCAVIMKNSPRRAAAHNFLTWLLSKPTQQKMQAFGFTPAS